MAISKQGSLKKLIDELGKTNTKILDEFAHETFKDFVRTTPVVTGTTRDGWKINTTDINTNTFYLTGVYIISNAVSYASRTKRTRNAFFNEISKGKVSERMRAIQARHKT